MNVGPPLIADAQPAELMQPSQGSLNHPTIDSEAAAVLGEALGQGPARSSASAVPLCAVPSDKLGLLEPGPVSDEGGLAGPELVEWPPPGAATGSRHDD